MKYIVGGRLTGKTTKMINLLRKNKNSILVTTNAHERDRLRLQFKDVADRIVAYYYFKNNNQDNTKDYYLDNADIFLQYLFCGRLKVISFNKD